MLLMTDNLGDPEMYSVEVFEMYGVPALAGGLVHR